MKYIFVTGGVVSSLGKGLTAAALGTLLENRGLKVALQKFDPYLNVDPGTMSPVPARRSLCARRRRRDRPRPRPLRAVHQRQTHPAQQPHQRPGLPDRAQQRARRQISRQDRPGHSARHRRNPEPHPRARPSRARPTSSSPKSAARPATSKGCRSSKPSASSRSKPGTATSSSSTSPTCRSSRPPAN